MKTFTSFLRRWQWAALSALLLIAAVSYYLPQRLSDFSAAVEREEEDEDRRDRPDLALLQEINRTRDPATGTVPRERLLVARHRADELLARQASQRASTGTLASATWTEKGPSNVAGRIRAILIDPADASGNTVWVGSVAGGLWKSTNATTATPTWVSVDGFMANLAITSLAYDPTNPDIMYMGTGEGFYNADAVRGLGIWKSTDHGATWSQLASTAPPTSSDFYRVQRLAVQQGTGYVFAATRTGLFRSKDKGATWAAVLQPAGIRMADVKISANGTIFVGAGIFQTGGIYRSTDNGDTWTNLNTLAGSGLPTTGYSRIELACAPSDANRVYAIVTTTADVLMNIYMSKDGGATWGTIRKPGGSSADFTSGQGWYALAIGVSPTSPNTLYVGGLDLWITNNADAAQTSNPNSGATWTQTSIWSTAKTNTNYVHADHHAIAWVPATTGTATKAFFVSDGGVAYSSNANATAPTYGQRNNGLNITQFYAVAVHPSDVNYFLAGAQDNGTQRYTTAGGQVTTEATGGDGAFCFIDQNEPQFQFTAYVYAQYRRSSTGGAAGSYTNLNISAANGQFINPSDYDSRSNTLYGGWSVDRFFRLTNATTAAATAATNVLLATGAGMVTHVTVSPNNQDRLFVGTEPDFAGGTSTQGHLYRVDNAASATPIVTLLYTAPAGLSVSSVAVETGNDAHLLLTMSNFSATEAKVLETTEGTNTGSATVAAATWTKRQGDLPDMPVRWAVFDPTNNKRALLATELGIWSTDDLSATSPAWKPSSTGLANVRVDMLRIRASDQQVVAATHGRGLFVSDVLKDQPLPVELTSFTGKVAEAGVALRWQTASEKNALRFDVERAAKDQAFQPLAKVAAAGTSTIAHNYAYTDATTGSGLYYYRLRQVDIDGTVSYSPVVTVQVTPTSAPLLTGAYPNPFGNELTLQLREPVRGDILVTLTDMQGRTVYSHKTQSTSRQVPVAVPATVAAGSYVLTVRAEGQKATRRVMHR
ncbi:T9SS type A sorting domain-containing protein [Hymenobacter lucidus]|uniref:T9SS type A sorting domain-containing protein n=1 Tax=Hymenobacter lucidus TaxID=2880930 RepID=A0ABS8ASL8_9BACT|nr:T9SS type A sorting domain-containing protein [Hymenobacter lucidus]MCB2409207.1 T9SS type A sorting domain-containing protein [Hymenobacter lucidus]